MNKKLLLLCMVAHVEFAPAADGFDRVGKKELPKTDIFSLCFKELMNRTTAFGKWRFTDD